MIVGGSRRGRWLREARAASLCVRIATGNTDYTLRTPDEGRGV